MRTLIFLMLFLSSVARAQRPAMPNENRDSLKKAAAKQKAANKKMAAKTQFTYFVINAAEKTFGYDVYADGNLYLHQDNIPGIGGNKGFADTASAGKVARFAIKKMRQGEIPPTITFKELERLQVTGLTSSKKQ